MRKSSSRRNVVTILVYAVLIIFFLLFILTAISSFSFLEDSNKDNGLINKLRYKGFKPAASGDNKNGGVFIPDLSKDVVVFRSAIASEVLKGVDIKHMHGILGYNEQGKLAYTTVEPIDVNAESKEDKKKHHTGFAFNKYRSDSLPLDRWNKDFRDPQCKVKFDNMKTKYFPNTSIIMVLYNEPFSSLLRSVHSVLNNSPPHLIKEIILVDDGSDKEWLKDELESYVKLIPKLVLVRMPSRKGLMEARSNGARVAQGDTLTFLDAHIEVNDGWLEPLMARIYESKNYVVMPFIDGIDADTFETIKGGLDVLGFNWQLEQKGIASRLVRNSIDPIPSVIMAGGLFSMDRMLFWDLGGYDPDMKLYGGEEIEISWRIWQCHASLEAIPCSRVAHIFRSNQYWQGSVFSIGNERNRNLHRAVEVWVEEPYKSIMKKNISPLPASMDIGSLDFMLNIKEKHKCKSFDWLLREVFPELLIPGEKRFLYLTGYIKNEAFGVCMATQSRHARDGMEVIASSCPENRNSENGHLFFYTKQNEIRIGWDAFSYCFDAGGSNGDMIIWGCHGGKGNQLVTYDRDNGRIQLANSKCLAYNGNVKTAIEMRPCDAKDKYQVWTWVEKPYIDI